MCIGAKPKMIKPPAPVLQPIQPNKTAEVKRGAAKNVTSSKGKTRRRGTARSAMVVNRNPAGVNKPSSGGVGVYN